MPIILTTGYDNIFLSLNFQKLFSVFVQQFPYQVRLYIATKTGLAYICGALIISPHVLMSAVHCFYGLNINYVSVSAGNIHPSTYFIWQQIVYVVNLIVLSIFVINFYLHGIQPLLLVIRLQIRTLKQVFFYKSIQYCFVYEEKMLFHIF